MMLQPPSTVPQWHSGSSRASVESSDQARFFLVSPAPNKRKRPYSARQAAKQPAYTGRRAEVALVNSAKEVPLMFMKSPATIPCSALPSAMLPSGEG